MPIITWCDDSSVSTTTAENTSPVGAGEKISYLHPISRSRPDVENLSRSTIPLDAQDRWRIQVFYEDPHVLSVFLHNNRLHATQENLIIKLTDVISILGWTVNPLSGFILPMAFYLEIFKNEARINIKVYIERIMCWVLITIITILSVITFVLFIVEISKN